MFFPLFRSFCMFSTSTFFKERFVTGLHKNKINTYTFLKYGRPSILKELKNAQLSNFSVFDEKAILFYCI